MPDSEAVKVAVRVRPFNGRETERNAKLIINMHGTTTEITNPEDPTDVRKYSFDHSYWSHDGYEEAEDGYLNAAAGNEQYVDQNQVFSDIGAGVLKNAWEGYNTTLFAYGQTGSGKSYSVVGYGPNKGIVPMLCDQIFKQINEKIDSETYDKENDDFTVQLSMIEIYNEQVKDLLNIKSYKKGGLRVRQSKDRGFIVESLKICDVSSYEDISNLIDQGTKARTIASTNMNATSSRAHTIVAIHFKQKALVGGKSMTRTSTINLVDLAGSERAESTGATGARLKEGAAINQSLSCLGNVIKSLADISLGKAKKNAVVPYRDSKLTMLLKNALGGNSKTVMIAALSPADINYDETLSTLRYADRAKAIKTTATINESPTDKLIRELREEIEALRLGGAMASGPQNAIGMSGEEMAEFESMKAQLEENERKMANMQQTWQDKLETANNDAEDRMQEEREKRELKKTTPHLWNLNEDPVLTGMIVYFFHPKPEATIVGAAEDVDIQLQGVTMMSQHAEIINKDNKKIFLKPMTAGANVTINGKDISPNGQTELFHNDRIMFGSAHLYAFHHPQDAFKKMKSAEPMQTPTFNDAQKEIAKEKGFDMSSEGKSKEDMQLQEDLIEIIPMVNEVNAISEELDKKTWFEIVLISPQARGETKGPNSKRTLVFVKMVNLVEQTEFFWAKDKFINRKFNMQEMYQNYQFNPEDLKSWDLPKDQDPFYEDPESTVVVVGSCQIYLENIAYKVDLDDSLNVTNYKGQNLGQTQVAILPLDSKGKPVLDSYVEDPSELMGSDLKFQLNVKAVKGLPRRFKNVHIEYILQDETHTSKKSKDSHTNFDFNYQNVFTWKSLTQVQLDILQNDHIFTRILANQRITENGLKDRKKTSTRILVQNLTGEGNYGRQLGNVSSNTNWSDANLNNSSSKNRINERKQSVKHSISSPSSGNLSAANSNQSDLESRLEIIRKICDKATTQGKQTVPLNLIQEVLNKGNIKLPSKLPDDVAVKEVIKYVDQGGKKSAACTIM